MNRLFRLVQALLLLALLAGPGTARGDDEAKPDSPHDCEDMTAFWPLWHALSAPSSPDGDRPLFPRTEIMAALRDVAARRPAAAARDAGGRALPAP